MLKDLVVWIYLRIVSTIALIIGAVASLLGGTSSLDTLQWIHRAERLPATVVEMIDQPKSAKSLPKQKNESNPSSEGTKTTAPPADAPQGEKPQPKQAACEPSQAPVVTWRDTAGVEHQFKSTLFRCPPSFKVGDTTHVLVDPQDASHVLLDTGGGRNLIALTPLIFAGIAIFVVLIVAWLFWPARSRIAGLLLDPATTESALPLAPDHSAGKPLGPLQGIVASADYIEDGKYPLELCEFTAYMAALAYHEPTRKLPTTLEDFLKSNFRQMRHVRRFDRDDTQGFGFVLDGAAFIILRGTKGWGDWTRNLKAGFAGPRELIPDGVDWQAPPRHRGFAEGWHVIRQDIEEWIAETGILKRDPRHPFIFAGHSLGGALSFIGAWEFARRGRNIAAVITFGAARPGDEDFAREYRELGLEKRTLRLEFTQDVVPLVQQYLGYKSVGRAWIPERIPLLSSGLALGAVPLNIAVSILRSSLFGSSEKPKRSNTPGERKRQDEQEKREEEESKQPTKETRTLKQIIAAWTFRLVLFLAFSSLLAVSAHKMQKRYALALSILSYRRIRANAALAAATSATGQGGALLDYNEAYDQLCRHLQDIRGSTPQQPVLYSTLYGLPRKVEGASDLKWLNAFHSGRSW